ncbi:MAG: aspartate kinase, partial [Planctomycetales bacterium]|nr:aspartate kinase [Planctomycetales bacterium]
RAVSLTGGQIGIRTDSTHTKARIKSISTDRMQRLLDAGNIVIAAGFQGIDEDFNITTLGRGGSDTTAVALAAVLNAQACEIYTDVDGVYTTDPRVVPEARRVNHISYDEMLELASLGAGVMHSRSIEFAKKYNVAIHVRSSMTDTNGTMIVADSESIDQPVCGAAMTKNEARVSVIGVPDVPGTSFEIFSRIADRKISVDMIVQNVSEEGFTDISFTVPKDELRSTLEAVQEAAAKVGAKQITHDDSVSKISVVGLGMARQSGVADRMFRALAEAGINIQMITTSEIKISVLVHRDEAQQALRLVHKAFSLEQAPAPVSTESQPAKPGQPVERPRTDAADVVSRLQGVDMEDLVITSVELDAEQATITIHGVPDTPGVAANVFEQVAAAGIFVDMIVQSYDGREGEASLSFTVRREDCEASLAAAKKLAAEYSCKAVVSNPAVAKLSVSGVGLRSHTGVAIRMFRALAAAGINVEMINTSEVRVNVIVEEGQGERAVAELRSAFHDVLR